MKRRYLLGLVITFIVTQLIGCSNKLKPDDSMFTTAFSIPNSAKANQPIEVVAFLENKSEKTWDINHAGTLFSFEVLDQKNNIISVQPESVFTVSIHKKIKMKEKYDPDSEAYNDKKIEITINEPGLYKVRAISNFTIDYYNERKIYKIESEMKNIEIIE